MAKIYVMLIALLLSFTGYSQDHTDLNSLYLNGKYQEVIKEGIKIFQNSNDTSALLLVAKSQQALYKYYGSIGNLELVYKSDSSNAQIPVLLSNAYEKLGNYATAKNYMSKAYNCDTSDLYLILNLALLTFLNDEMQSSAALYKKALAQDQENIYILNAIGDLYRKVDSVELSLYYYKEVLKLSKDQRALARASTILINNKEYSEALNLLLDYSDGDSKIPNRNLGICYFQLDSLNKALNVFSNLMQKGDSSKIVLESIGSVYYKKEDYDKSEYYFERAYILDTTDLNTIVYLASAYCHNYKVERGIALLDKAYNRIQPDNNFLRFIYTEYAYAHLIKQEYLTAINYYKKIMSLARNPIEIRYEIVRIYDYDLKDYITAYKLYTELTKYLEEKEQNRKISIPEKMILMACQARLLELKEEFFFKGKISIDN